MRLRTISTGDSGRLCCRDGRVYFGTTVYRGRVAFRPAIANWRTTEADTDMIVSVTRELIEREDWSHGR